LFDLSSVLWDQLHRSEKNNTYIDNLDNWQQQGKQTNNKLYIQCSGFL